MHLSILIQIVHCHCQRGDGDVEPENFALDIFYLSYCSLLAGLCPLVLLIYDTQTVQHQGGGRQMGIMLIMIKASCL